MPEKDLARAWERYCGGESLGEIATTFGVQPSALHQSLQGYLARREQARQIAIRGAA